MAVYGVDARVLLVFGDGVLSVDGEEGTALDMCEGSDGRHGGVSIMNKTPA